MKTAFFHMPNGLGQMPDGLGQLCIDYNVHWACYPLATTLCLLRLEVLGAGAVSPALDAAAGTDVALVPFPFFLVLVLALGASDSDSASEPPSTGGSAVGCASWDTCDTIGGQVASLPQLC